MDPLKKLVEKNILAVVFHGDVETINLLNYNYIIILYNRSTGIPPIMTGLKLLPYFLKIKHYTLLILIKT